MAVKDYEEEYADYVSRYAYMDTPEHKSAVLSGWKDWTSKHEAINQMVKSCFDFGGKVDLIKLNWIITNKCSCKTLDGLIGSCFRGTDEKLISNDSRLANILKLIIRNGEG